MVDLPAYGANSAPTDRFWIASAAVGFALGSAADKYITANDFCAEITRNVTDISLQFGSGSGVSTVSAANKGKIRYDSAGQSFQVSENGGAYQNLLKGSGTATRVMFWSAADEASSDAALYWDNTNKRLSVGVGTSPGAPIDVLAESASAIAQQWRPNTGTMRAAIKLDGGPETFFGTTTPHNFHLITNSIQRLSIEDSSGNVGINKPSLIAAQLQVVANAATTKPLILNSAPATSVNLAEFYNDASVRFTFSNAGNLLLGKAGASGATGSLTFAVNGQANTQTLQGGDTPVSTNAFKWPNADPLAGQALTASAPVAGAVTMSWTTVITGPANPNQSVQFNNSGAFGGDGAFLWDNINKRLSVGVGASPGAPIDVLAESVSAIAQQWRPNTGTMRAVIKLDGGPETFFGTSTAHNLHLITTGQQRLSIEATSGNVGINKPSLIGAQLQVVANAATTIPLILNSAPATSVNLAEFYNDSSIRFTFGNAGNLLLGKAGASGATGSLTFAVNGQANTQTLQGGDTPVSTNAFKWPNADPLAGQALTASAPVAGVVTMSWTTISAGATINPTDGVMPVRSNSTTFIDSPLSVASSAVTMTRSGIGATSSDGIVLLNATAAAAGAQQFSPRLRLTGQGWKTTAAAASQTVDWIIETRPVQGTASPTVQLAFARQVNTGGFSDIVVFDSIGGSGNTVSITGASTTSLSATASISAGNGFITIEAQTYRSASSGRIRAGGSGFLGFQSPNATYIFGNDDAAAPVAQTLSVQNVVAGTSNTAGTNWTFAASRGTGTGSGGSFIWQVAAAGTSGTSQNALAQAMSLNSAGQLLIAPSTASATGNLTVLPDNAATSTIVTVARLGVNSTGAAADGFGAALSWSAKTSTTSDTETGRENVFWTTATHASRTSATSWSLVNNATLAEIMRLGTPSNNVGSPFVLTIHDGTNPNVWTAGAFAAKLYLISPTLPAVGVAAHFSATGADAPVWQMLRGRGTNASPTAVQNSDRLGAVQFAGQTSTSTNNFAIGAEIRVSATQNWSAGNTGCQMVFFTSNNAGTITDRMYLTETGTLRVGATSGTYNTTTLVQVGNYASWNTDVVAAIYTGANATKGLEIIGTSAQTANLFRVFLDAGADLFNVFASGAFSSRALTVATLPSAATVGAGGRSFVTDSTTTIIVGLGLTVTGGGTNKVPVYSDGSNWIIG
jgi:hypothetical protein